MPSVLHSELVWVDSVIIDKPVMCFFLEQRSSVYLLKMALVLIMFSNERWLWCLQCSAQPVPVHADVWPATLWMQNLCFYYLHMQNSWWYGWYFLFKTFYDEQSYVTTAVCVCEITQSFENILLKERVDKEWMIKIRSCSGYWRDFDHWSSKDLS